MSQPARCTMNDVTEKLGTDWDAGNPEEGREPRSVMGFIRSASALVDSVVTCAALKGITLTAELLWAIEVAMAAGLYCRSDPKYQSRSTAGGSGAFQQDQRDKGINNSYEQEAVGLDYSGCLRAILTGRRAGLSWLGKPQSQQINVDMRN